MKDSSRMKAKHARLPKLVYLFLSIFVLFACAKLGIGNKPDNWGSKRSVSFAEVKKTFDQPDMIYAPFVYWFWDAPLDVQQIAHMTEEMCRQRLNPGYVMARDKRGIGIPHEQWLSPLWFEAIGAAAKKARESQAYFGYCDEYKWPSGSADGRVLAANPDLAAVSLKWEIMEAKGGESIGLPESFFTVAAQCVDSHPASDYQPAIKSSTLRLIGGGGTFFWTAPEGTWRIYSFSKYHQRGIDGGEVNYLDRRLPKAFIEIAHQSYVDQWGKQLGKTFAGVFVDHEGDYGFKLAWSDDLAKEYKQKRGRDIRVWMPLLIDEDSEGTWPKARWDWYDVVSDLYADNLIGGVSRWLEERGLYCISNLWEENLINQAVLVGDFFKAQRAVTFPGNDALFSRALNVHDFKETQSVAEFEDRRFMSEILGVAGWGMTPVLMKQAVNSVIAWGVNHIVPHGINLNRNLHQAPYPPDWFTSNPYWPYLHHWTDFVRRASYINSQGHLVPQVLVLNPMDSIWGLLGDSILDAKLGKTNYNYNALQAESHDQVCRHGKTIDEIEKIYSTAIKELTETRIEYLIADVHYFRQMSFAKDGRLVRKPFEFKALIIPSVLMLPLDVARKIFDYAAGGGRVYLFGALPSWSTDNGVDDPQMKETMDKLVKLPTVRRAEGGIKQLLAENAPFVSSEVVFESGEFPMLQLHRRIDNREFFWLANNTGQPQQCTVTVQGIHGSASIWNCEDGMISEIPAFESNGGTRVSLNFDAYEAFWLVIDPQSHPAKAGPKKQSRWMAVDTLMSHWRVRIDTTAQPVPAVPRPAISLDLLSDPGVERPLESWLNWDLKQFTGYVDYAATVACTTDSSHFMLDLGDVKHMAEVWVNGEAVGQKLWPPFKFDLGRAMRQGDNHIKIRVGNLLSNAMKQEGESGLFGPVVLMQEISE